ncbi:hypothetical protein AB4Y96_13095 [Phyllobacterium sp. TAF24]|uniref:hypothetical protein n=1 Tax=Phyllobacterium sp. TAF24 TaxID=3233068 RepID=UPI003F9CC549
MTAPTLIIVGDRDVGRLSIRGAEWWHDAYDLSPSPKALFTAYGGEHALSGIPGYEARETNGPSGSARIDMFGARYPDGINVPLAGSNHGD